MNSDGLRIILENSNLKSSLVEYCLKDCIKQDGKNLTDVEKNCLKTCQTNYQTFNNLYLKKTSPEKIQNGLL